MIGPDAGEGSGPDQVTVPEGPARGDGARRQTVEFLIFLGLGLLLLRTFAAEAYVVPTGSMAPTLLGFHREMSCPNCRYPFVIGTDESGRSGRPVCPNCGEADLAEVPAVECSGDRLLVEKYFFDVRRPTRWEIGVFHSPAEPDQAYVKRVVGLPGEAIQIVDGDVFINGRIARKSPREQRAMRILVFDNDFRPADSDRFPRWRFRGDGYKRAAPSGWQAEGTSFVHDPTATSTDREDWLEYRHWDPDRAHFGPIRDFCPYNGGDRRSDNVVRDVMVEAEVSTRPDVRSVALRIDHGGDHFTITLPVDGQGVPDVRRNGLVQDVTGIVGGLTSSPANAPRFQRLEASAVDRRVSVCIDGIPLFDPIDYETGGGTAYGTTPSPVALGVLGGSMEARRLRIYRDIYYTGHPASGVRRPHGVDRAYLLGEDEFFVLGDNSPVSNDSRFWEASPVVPGDRFLGKPFLVHLPGQVFALRVFGRQLGWIPDPREIRYIH